MTIALQMQLDELPTAILSVGGVCGQGPVLLEGYGGFGPVLVQKNAASQDDFINTFLQGLNSSNWG